MPNMKSMINKQNTSRLNNSDNKVDAKQCNCRPNKNCSLNGKCCRNSIVYKASLKTGETDKFFTAAAKHHLNSDTITIINPLKTVEKLTPLNYPKPSGN